MTTPDGSRMLRIGDAERMAAASALGDHFAAGRLDQAELDERLSRAYAARTYDDLEPLFVDLPEPHPARPVLTGQVVDPPKPAPRAPWPVFVPPLVAARRLPVALRVLKTAVAILLAMVIVGTILTLLPLILLLMVLSGPGRRQRHRQRWQRWQERAAGRPPWGGDNGAWFQFGYSGRDWSHTARPRNGYPRHGLPDQRPHRRKH
jgi:uncharacterized protein DUF1707